MKLYIHSEDNGDGSNSTFASLDRDYCEKAKNDPNYPYDAYQDFRDDNPMVINVPDNSTEASLGIKLRVAGDWDE